MSFKNEYTAVAAVAAVFRGTAVAVVLISAANGTSGEGSGEICARLEWPRLPLLAPQLVLVSQRG